jgi:cytochrome c oxidase cbb3-type subunit 1
MVFHYLVVGLNLKDGLAGGRGNPVLGFASFGLVAYLVGGLVEAVFSFRTPAELVQFTYFPVAQSKLLLGGAFSFLIFAAIYEMGPRLAGVAWPSSGLVRVHFLTAAAGTVVTVIGLAWAGLAQGNAQLVTANSFAAVAAAAKPGLLLATAGEITLLVAAIIAKVHFARLQFAACCGGSERAVNPVPTTAVP